jgi:hypothetical protein
MSSISSGNEKNITLKSLPKGYTQKLKKTSDFLAAELSNKGIRKVEVKIFTDASGRVTKESKIITDKFIKFLSGNQGTVISSSDAEAIISGVLTPFKGKKKWRLQIKVVSTGTNIVIISYEGYIR